jgi:hypothetical protein
MYSAKTKLPASCAHNFKLRIRVDKTNYFAVTHINIDLLAALTFQILNIMIPRIIIKTATIFLRSTDSSKNTLENTTVTP